MNEYALNRGEIVRMHVEERMTLNAIAKEKGITRERARQIVRREGVSPAVTAEILREKGARVVTMVCETCGKVEERRPSLVRMFCSMACRVRPFTYTEDQLLNAMRLKALSVGHTPGSLLMQNHMTYVYRFGSMAEAHARAGLTPNERGKSAHPLPNGFREQWEHLL